MFAIPDPPAGGRSRLSVIAGEGLPRGPWVASIRERSGSPEVTSSAVTRAIEDLKGSGYRPLHPDPTGPPRATIPGYRRGPGHGTDADPM